MKKFLCIALLFISLILNAQTKVEPVYKEKRYPNGKLMYKGYFLKGSPVGEFIRYYSHGAIKAKMNYKNSSVYANLYNERGQLTAKGKYIGKKKDSTWLYYKNNRVVGRDDYCKGLLEGKVVKYFPNGKIADSKEFQNGKKHGKWERYFKDGQLRCNGKYKNGQLHGEFRAYSMSGIKEIEGFFMNNLREGTWCFYNNSGEFLFKVDYENGVPKNLDEFEKMENDDFLRLKKSELNFVDPQDYIDSPEEYIIKSRKSGNK